MRCVIVVGSFLSSVFTYPCVSRLTVEVFIFSGSSNDEVHGKRPGSLNSSRCVNNSLVYS